MPVVEVECEVERPLERLEVLLARLARGDAGLEVLSPEEHVGVLQPGTPESDSDRNPDEMRRVDLYDLVVCGPVFRYA